ncbi:MAG: hypothetical protein L3J79_06955, partial [Candidatus Marinimicrobia bacterium]|nr:hypothetical protein [Candidatus Neomarinimicrobiota bacterium]
MEVTRKEVYFNNTPLNLAVGRGFEAMIRYWGDYIPPERHAKTFITTCFAMSEYFKAFPPSTDDIQPFLHSDGKPAIEFTIALPTEVRHPITGDPILYSGRCDMLGTFPSPDASGRINVVGDDKTTKGIGPMWRRQWNMRGQFYGYTYAMNQGGIQCEHALVRGISLQTTQNKFASVVVPLPYWRQERWWYHTNLKIKQLAGKWDEMIRVREELDNRIEPNAKPYERLLALNTISHTIWPMSVGQACENYGGCTFKSLCTRKNPAMWYDDYDRGNWDPLAKNPTADSVNSLANMRPIGLPQAAKDLLG